MPKGTDLIRKVAKENSDRYVDRNKSPGEWNQQIAWTGLAQALEEVMQGLQEQKQLLMQLQVEVRRLK